MPPDAPTQTAVDIGLPPGVPGDFQIQEPATNAKSLQDTAKLSRQAARAAVAAKIAPETKTVATAAKTAASAQNAALIPDRVRALSKDAELAASTPAATETAEADAPIQAEAPATTAAATPAEQSRLERVKEASKIAKKSAARNRNLVAEKQRLEGQLQSQREQLSRENAQLRQQAEQGQRLADTLNKDPVAAMKLLGINEEAMTQRMLQAGTPEAQIQEMQRQYAVDRAEYQRQINDLKEGITKEKSAASLAAAEAKCWSKAREADKYPHLQRFSKESILFQVKDIAIRDRQWYAAKGITVQRTDRQILAKLNALHAPGEETPQVATKPAKGAQAGQETQAKAKSAGRSPRTLTKDTANGGVAKPSNWESLPRAERLSILKGG
jgi:hypothetical protein